MKLVKSLLLGSAAGLFAVAGAQAADLPVKKAAPVDYVRVCSTYGSGFFFLPGTDTCFRISGFVRADYLYLEPFRRDFDATGFRARARLNFDFRQPTEYGLLRAFIRYEITRNTGAFVASGQSAASGGVFFNGNASDTATIPLAYVQFGGFTAGRVQSFYDFFANDDLFTTLLGQSDLKTQAFAYTATFGGGWSATIAIEDPIERRSNSAPLDTSLAGLTVPSFVPVDPFAPVPQALAPAGAQAPDVVGVLRVDQAWGSAQLSGAAHQIRANNIIGVSRANGNLVVSLPGAVPGNVTPQDNPDDEWGFAIQGGVKFNLPMIAAGDQLWLQAAYADGALGYTHTSPFTSARAGTFRLNQNEAIINPLTGDIEKTQSWGVSGKLLHFWTPNLRSNLFGAYSEIDYDAVGTRTFVDPLTGIFVNAGFNDLRIYEAGANLIWSPVKGLDIGVEGIYRKFDTKGNVAPAFGNVDFATGVGTRDVRFGSRDNQDAWEARLRVQRDF